MRQLSVGWMDEVEVVVVANKAATLTTVCSGWILAKQRQT